MSSTSARTPAGGGATAAAPATPAGPEAPAATPAAPGPAPGAALAARARPRSRPRAALAAGILLLVALAAAAALSLGVGARPVPPSTVWDALTAADPANGDHAVVLSRIPRTVGGLLVGAALALAGAAMQGLARNPLADPGILGVNAGAALAVVLGIHLAGLATVTGYIWFAFAGAALAAVLVYLVASLGREGATPVKLALAGAAVAAGLASVMNGVLMVSLEALDGFRFWQAGTLGARSLEDMARVLPFLAAGAAVCLASPRWLNALALGDDAAVSLGVRIGRARAVTGLGAVVLCGAATALAGPIAFVGLIVPHAVRALAGSDYRAVLPLSALAGPVLLLAADTAGRVLLPPTEIQVGVMTALVGAPVFIWLIRSRKQVSL